ncbi:MAG: (d)CMP kinase [Calditrichaceae bacterium]|nr:(d)CMP kinase [Calditrichaceae bacterium]RQV97559.1 MAG: (d)CMP kinase [Calditrichota bacterium]
MSRRINIAIDGPASSGKSTTAKLAAEKLGYIYIDTGAMYRAATLAVNDEGVDINDEQAVTSCINNHRISISIKEKQQRTYLDDQDVTDQLRTPQINKTISVISSYKEVRKAMVEQQRQLAEKGGVIMDGRDIGTVVLPDAELKVFMIASLEERAKRRFIELEAQGIRQTLEEVKEDIRKRDRIDSSRSLAPLKKAEGAKELDTTGLTIEEQLKIILDWVDIAISEKKRC